MTGSIAVCPGSSGPGNMHLINGFYDGTNLFQETRPDHLFKDCSYYCEVMTTAHQMPRSVLVAMQNAVSRKGVSVLVLPGDVAAMKQTIPPYRNMFFI